MTLEQIKQMAQRDANRARFPCVILNFNRVGTPVYVIREYSRASLRDPGYVETIMPQEEPPL